MGSWRQTSPRWGRRVALALAAGVLAAPVAAQVGQRGPAIVTDLPRAQAQAVQAWVRNRRGTAVPPIEFKVPAQSIRQVICNVNAEGIRCYESLVALQCPTDIVVQLPDGSTTRAPVSCTGPDRDGNCECDFASP